jgi:hypothetical protein
MPRSRTVPSWQPLADLLRSHVRTLSGLLLLLVLAITLM